MGYFAPIKAVQFMCTNKVRISTADIATLKGLEGKLTVQCKKETVNFEGSRACLQSEGFRLVEEARLLPSVGVHNTGGTNVRFPTITTVVIVKNGLFTVFVEKANIKIIGPRGTPRMCISLVIKEDQTDVYFDDPKIDRVIIPLKGDCKAENFSAEEILALQKGEDMQFPFELELFLC